MHASKPRFNIWRAPKRTAALVAFVGCLVLAQAANAGCPPGYLHKAGHCIPGQSGAHASSGSIPSVPAAQGVRAHVRRQTARPTAIDRSAIPPQPGVPIEHHAGAADTHGIIFVGGKNAINSRPVPPGHSPNSPAINSQPVPPGRSLKRIPNPGTPVEQKIGH